MSYFKWSCGSVSAVDAQSLSPSDHKRVEAIMMLALGVCDEEGRKVGIRVPPSFAVAVIRALGADEPVSEASEIIESTLPKIPIED
jgi:hypothetical protein